MDWCSSIYHLCIGIINTMSMQNVGKGGIECQFLFSYWCLTMFLSNFAVVKLYAKLFYNCISRDTHTYTVDDQSLARLLLHIYWKKNEIHVPITRSSWYAPVLTIFLKNSSEFCFKFGQKWLLFKDLFGEVHAVRTPIIWCCVRVMPIIYCSFNADEWYLSRIYCCPVGPGEKPTTNGKWTCYIHGIKLTI